MAFLNHLYIGTGNSINLSQFNSLLEFREKVKVNPAFSKEFNDWALKYSDFIYLFQNKDKGYSLHQMTETAAFLAQKYLTREFPEVSFELSSYYTDMHDRFKILYEEFNEKHEDIILHLIIINLSLNTNEQIAKDVYEFCLTELKNVLEEDCSSNIDAFELSDLLMKLYYDQSQDFHEVYLKHEDKNFEDQINRFIVSMFGSSLNRKMHIPTDFQVESLTQAQIRYGLESNEETSKLFLKYEYIITKLEILINEKFSTSRHKKYNNIIKNEHRAIHMINKEIMQLHPMLLHPLFSLKASSDIDTINDIFKAYYTVWMKFSEEVRNPKSRSFKIGDKVLKNIDSETEELTEDDLFFIDFTVHMRAILNMNRLIEGSKAYCCDKHSWQHFKGILTCQEEGGLRWQCEMLYGQDFLQLFGMKM